MKPERLSVCERCKCPEKVRNLTLIDAHTHVFPNVNGINKAGPTLGIGHGRASVGAKTMHVTPDFGATTSFLPGRMVSEMDAAGVQQVVLLQGPFWGECNACAAEAVRQYPDRFVAQAYLDPWDDDWQARLDKILGAETFRGIKIEFSEATGLAGIHSGARLDDHDLDLLWATLARENRVLTLDLGAVAAASYQTRAVARLALQHPSLRIVICHLAQPCPAVVEDSALMRLWQEQIDLGRMPNVYFDTASLPAYFLDDGYPFSSCRDFIERAVETVGPEKILWGSDVPGTLTACTYSQYVELALRHTDFLSASQQEQILSKNAGHVYGSPNAN